MNCTEDRKEGLGDDCQELIEIFQHYDKDNSGSIDPQELKNLLATMSEPISEEEFNIGLSIIDRNQNGRIEFAEFLNWWRNR